MGNPRALTGAIEEVLEAYKHHAQSGLVNAKAEWWWLSFCTGDHFKGVFIVHASGFLHAVYLARHRNICPAAGDVCGAPIPPDFLPPENYLNKLLNEGQVRECTPNAVKIAVGDDGSGTLLP
jgi:hypothetical protein